jgi:Uma2 family endonuclease
MRQAPAFTPRRWTRAEYDRLIGLGAFDGERIGLIGGQLLVSEPHGAYHASTIGHIHHLFDRILPPGWVVRSQAPIALDDESEPEPDIALVRGTHADYRSEHPARPALIIEVADSSLTFDRRHKSSLYARGGVDDYWIVSVTDQSIEIHRDPIRDPTAPYRWRYRSVERFTAPALFTPLSLPSLSIAVADLIP